MKYLLLVGMVWFVSWADASTMYLIRHAEKVDDGSKDPVLTIQGEHRAQNIANQLSTAKIEKIYATDYQRTQLTAKPLADFLGLEIISYDPSKLSEFADQLKAEAANALIVGHSNTTPMLTYLLSGQPVMSLDEEDYDNIFQVSLAGETADLNQLKSLPTQVTQALSTFTPNHVNFFSGELHFNMLFQDEVVGTSVHSFAHADGAYLLAEKTIIEKMNIDADIKTSVDSKSLTPQRLSMTGTMGLPVAIQLDWQGQKITGHSDMAREPFKTQGKIEIDATMRANTLERTSAIMLAHLMPVTAEQPLLVNWFNGYDGDQRLINITYEGEEEITVPAGTFNTYKIKYSGGAPSQYYWVDKKQPKVVKIEVIKMPWTYQLKEFSVVN